ncbi:hypothetical protein M404DRAFT_897761 [Pisolithus tinctorius Marx 270]|uniref:Uncharacterized protein n=1 Tax=Pisolithus tinctorius Marx 270 TaxID=870435 RepID=A0A0C3NP40_PISTI|nr:hypothetical protein M404DRAFT_897761 [Pisolithus tinctorius Marx 270]
MTFRRMEISAYITFSKRVVKEVVRRVDVESDFEGQGLSAKAEESVMWQWEAVTTVTGNDLPSHGDLCLHHL